MADPPKHRIATVGFSNGTYTVSVEAEKLKLTQREARWLLARLAEALATNAP